MWSPSRICCRPPFLRPMCFPLPYYTTEFSNCSLCRWCSNHLEVRVSSRVCRFPGQGLRETDSSQGSRQPAGGGDDQPEDLPALHPGEGLLGGGLLLGLHTCGRGFHPDAVLHAGPHWEVSIILGDEHQSGAGDFRGWLLPLCLIFRYFFRSGNIEHPGDKLFNTSVEVLPFDVSPQVQVSADSELFPDFYFLKKIIAQERRAGSVSEPEDSKSVSSVLPLVFHHLKSYSRFMSSTNQNNV